MASPFLDLDQTKAVALLDKPDGFEEAEAMAYRDEPDQWACGGKAGDGFLGPTGLDLSGLDEAQRRAVAPLDSDVRGSLKRAFVPVDRLSEVLDRRTDGPLGHKPRSLFEVARTLEGEEEPTADEAARLKELDDVLAWAERPRVGFHRLLRKLDRAKSCFGRASLRAFVPAGRLVEETEEVEPGTFEGTGRFSLPDVKSPKDALRHIFLEVVTPDRAVVHEDEDTRDQAAVVSFDPVRARRRSGLKARPASVEVSFAGDTQRTTNGVTEPDTVVRHVEGKEVREAAYALRGRPMLVELRDDAGPFLDANARKLQKAINTASTEERIVLDEDGFRVRVLLGARPPGRWTTEVVDGETRPKFIPEPWALSPRSILNVGGEEVYSDELGPDGLPVVTGVSEPSIGTFEAADPEGYRKEVEERTLQLRERCKQAWVHTTGEAGVSGISREVAMADYLTDAMTQAQSIEAAAAAALELVADLAAHLAGQGGRYYDLVARVECKVSKPPMRPEEKTAAAALVKDRLWSRRRAMQETGVDDTQAEVEEIAAEEEADAERAQKRLPKRVRRLDERLNPPKPESPPVPEPATAA